MRRRHLVLTEHFKIWFMWKGQMFCFDLDMLYLCLCCTVSHPPCFTSSSAIQLFNVEYGDVNVKLQSGLITNQRFWTCCEKKLFCLKTIYFAAGKRHTDLKLCVDRTGSIPTARLYISSMCWNGKNAIDLCALVLYSNISNEQQNKRGTVRHARGELP